MSELGKVAYEAYAGAAAVSPGSPGGAYPAWDYMEPWQHKRWEAAGQAVCAHVSEFAAPAAESSRQWAVLELMGHRQAVGAITETTIAGRQMITIDRIDTEPASTQHYGPDSVYCLTPVTEDQARLLANSRYKTHIVPPALTAAVDDDDDDDDDGEGPWDFGEGDT